MYQYYVAFGELLSRCVQWEDKESEISLKMILKPALAIDQILNYSLNNQKQKKGVFVH